MNILYNPLDRNNSSQRVAITPPSLATSIFKKQGPSPPNALLIQGTHTRLLLSATGKNRAASIPAFRLTGDVQKASCHKKLYFPSAEPLTPAPRVCVSLVVARQKKKNESASASAFPGPHRFERESEDMFKTRRPPALRPLCILYNPPAPSPIRKCLESSHSTVRVH